MPLIQPMRVRSAVRSLVAVAGVVGLVVVLSVATAAAQDDEPQPAPAAPTGVPVRVLTCNVQGLPAGIAPHRAERIAQIGPAIRALQPPPDIVCLQEVWVADDRRHLLEALAQAGLVHGRNGDTGGLVGSGLLIASRWPITDCRHEAYHVAGVPWFSDWWSRKGFQLATIATPRGAIRIVNTHCHAGYGNPETDAFRVAQLWQLATRAQSDAGPDSAPLLVTGDLNCRPGDLPFNVLAERLKLSVTPADAGRIDHVLAAAHPPLRVAAVRVVLDGPVEVAPGVRIPLSDHVGWLAEVTFDKAGGREPAGPGVFADAAESVRAADATAATRLWIVLPVTALVVVGWALWTFRKRVKHERSWRTRLATGFRWGVSLLLAVVAVVLVTIVIGLLDLRTGLAATGLLS